MNKKANMTWEMVIGILIALAVLSIIISVFFPNSIGLTNTAVNSAGCQAQIGLAKGFCTNDYSSCDVSRPASKEECPTATHCCYNSDGSNPNPEKTADAESSNAENG